MIQKQRLWDIQEYNQEKAGCLAGELGISPLVTGILLERGLQDAESMREFLYGAAEPFHDPFLLKDMERSVQRIEAALAAGEKITVYGDYDVDGITASSLLYIYLRQRGAKVQTYIPQRQSEGYGLNDEALKTLAADGTTLLVTVDCGISGLHEVERAPKSMDIIITDHHTVPELLPPAYAIVNAKQRDCAYPFKDLSGVGIAFKLCQALEQRTPGQLPKWQELTELAALGTVADIVPLLGENRELVRRGLKAMMTTKLVGLRALIKASGCAEKEITSENIGFGLAPRLNAVGRLEHAQSAVELLVTNDSIKAEQIATELNRENALRQEISRQIQAEAEAQLAQLTHIDTAIVLGSEGWHQGVIGIVASRLVEKYHLPTILLSFNGDMAKGSCRSIPALNLYEAIAAESDILTQFGGHHQAAGLTLPRNKVAEFRERFRAYVAAQLKPEDYLPHQQVDCVVSGNTAVSVQDLQELSLLEPCGCSNPAPVFAFTNAVLRGQRAMGKERNHLQFNLVKGDNAYRCVMWNNASLLPYMFENMLADVAFQPKLNTWNNEISVQLHSVSLRQQLAVADLRQSREDKYRLLAAVAGTLERLTVYVQSPELSPELAELRGRLAQYLDIRSYDSCLPGSGAPAPASVVALLELPAYPLRELIGSLRQQGVRRLLLLFNSRDAQQAVAQLRLTHPDHDAMVVAYKLVMQELQAQSELELNGLLMRHQGELTEVAVKIMQELGFIGCNNGIITKGIIRRCSLEASPLYASLEQERGRRQRLYQENLRLSQYELLRS